MKDSAAFNGGCTEVISPKALLTNHHCGYSQIQSHSSVDKDYLADGFGPIKWKTNYHETVNFMVKLKT
jgi:V8-like Glu-specific endopeptidase